MYKQALQTYSGKRVLVTGDTGFKGSWLSLWLKKLGADVYGLALPPQPKSHFEQIKLQDHITHFDADIRDLDAVQKVVDKVKPEMVFHLAAQALVGLSYDDPKQTFDTNVGGSMNVLEAIRHQPSVKTVVYITSDKCYLNIEQDAPYHEADELGGKDPYSASKACAEHVIYAYRESFFNKRDNFSSASTRAGNVIGGGDFSDKRIVPDIMRALMADDSIILRKPEATRPWQHVLDPLLGYLFLGAKLHEHPGQFDSAWNFGPHPENVYTVEELTKHFIEAWGSGQLQVQRDENAPAEATLLSLDITKAKDQLGWQPQLNFVDTVHWTTHWYKQVHEGAKPFDVTNAQLDGFMERLS